MDKRRYPRQLRILMICNENIPEFLRAPNQQLQLGKKQSQFDNQKSSHAIWAGQPSKALVGGLQVT